MPTPGSPEDAAAQLAAFVAELAGRKYVQPGQVAALGRLHNFRGLAPVAGRASGPGSSPATTLLGGTSRIFFPLVDQSRNHVTLLPVYENFYGASDDPTANPITIAAAVEDGSKIVPFTFAGAHLGVLSGGATMLPDAPITVAASTATYATNVGTGTVKGVWIRTYVSVTTGQAYPIVCSPGYTSTGEVNGESTSGGADLTLPGSAAVTAGTGALSYCYGPRAVLGPATKSTLWGAFGDSIVNGAGDVPPHHGYIDRAQVAAGIPVAKIGRPGEYAQSFAVSPNRGRRASYFSGLTHALVGYGTNDLANARTPAQLKADLTTIVGVLVAAGIKVHLATVTPRTSSTDAWVTPGNQTPIITQAAAQDVNDWMRGLPAGVSGCFDLAGVVSSGVNSGLWGQSAGLALTQDGIHPNFRGHGLIGSSLATYLAANA